MKQRKKGWLVIYRDRSWNWDEVYLCRSRVQADQTRSHRHEIAIPCVIEYDDGKRPAKRKRKEGK